MAELAAGAMTSLLGVIRNEARLLGRVRNDIQEEMESMKSFLAYLARTDEHDEQVGTWMNQVWKLAQDCNQYIDLYLYRGNPEFRRARGGLQRYVSCLPWFVRKIAAQHNAVVKLRELKDRARHIGERRSRYGVEVPAKAREQSLGLTLLSTLSAHAAVAASEDDEDEDGDDHRHSGSGRPRGAFFEPRTLEDNVRVKLAGWLNSVAQGRWSRARTAMPSIAIVAPDAEDTRAIADEVLHVEETHLKRINVLVDIQAVHNCFQFLRCQDILYYILWDLQQQKQQQQQQEQSQPQRQQQLQFQQEISAISTEKQILIDGIEKDIQGMKVDNKISKINHRIGYIKSGMMLPDKEKLDRYQLNMLESTKDDEPLGLLVRALWPLKIKFERYRRSRPPPALASAASKPGQESKKTRCPHSDIIEETAKKLKEHMEAGEVGASSTCLEAAQYEHILREVFPEPLQTQEEGTKATVTGSTIAFGEDQIKEMIRKVLQERLQEDKSSMEKLDTQSDDNNKPGQDPTLNADLIEETKEKIGQIEEKMKEQLKIKGIMDKIDDIRFQLDGGLPILVILKLDRDYVTKLDWEETRITLGLADWIAGALMLTTEENTAQANYYCYPPEQEPIDYSLHGLYRDAVLELINQQMNEHNPNSAKEEDGRSQIFLDILGKCVPHEFCMKIFVHALFANPSRSNDELSKLLRNLQFSEKSLDNNAKEMLKFSYSDLPIEYKSCLLYLAIFPRRQSIRRSTLIGRWVAEGLITKEDWPSSVRRANRCFDALIDRWLVYPDEIGATGHVKSCVVGDLVHGFITKIARKQRIVETRMSRHLARHFSIFNHLRLSSSDRIDSFFQKLSEESSRVSLIKVLDLEGCRCFGGKNQRYLKDICSNILLLKYLSLRRTDVTQLPSEINNLHELEVLDIRQTNVPASEKLDVLLLKLRRFLAGGIGPSPSCTELSSVRVPDKIEKMFKMEVLSNVKARNSKDLKDIGKLLQLRKLGVVIEQRDSHLRNLFRSISDLHECLRSLSITLPISANEEGSPNEGKFPDVVLARMEHSPKLLESLSITGTTQKGQLLQLLAKDKNQLAKVTLSRTRLNQAVLKALAKLPKLFLLVDLRFGLEIKGKTFKEVKRVLKGRR